MPEFTISLAAARANANLTQNEMAQAMHVHKATIQNWENGKTSPDYNQVKAISSITRIPIDYLFLPDTLLKVDKMNGT